MNRIIWMLALLFATVCLKAGEFTVVTYNVENLFDLDGVAEFSEYRQEPEGDYGLVQLMKKLEHIHETLSAFNDGAGPEIILFQELELDRTPFGTPDAEAFLKSTKGQSIRELLERNSWARNLPSDLILLKYLEDKGMTGYEVARPDSSIMEYHPAHQNVTFSRYPIKYVRQRPMLDARDMLVTGVDVDGHELVLLNNHWKSGASDARTEPIRVQNALVVRAEVEAILFRNPDADVILAGDFNCYYNHGPACPDMPRTGMTDILQPHGFEEKMTGEDASGLYNLWFELPDKERGSEVWRGQWGTLMQMILTPGLYDNKGVQYVDNSFNRLILPGRNVEDRWGTPISWTNWGTGAGYSDHLAVYARFKAVGEGEGWMELDKPSREKLSAYRPRVNYSKMNRKAVPEINTIAKLPDSEKADKIASLFRIDQKIEKTKPVRIRVGDQLLEVYSPISSIRDSLNKMQPGDKLTTLATLGDWRGNLQVVIQDSSWMK
ncbi:MAG: endonuclease/exonuclease/phosphatase family protein [Puniceicoccaceae bacterium]